MIPQPHCKHYGIRGRGGGCLCIFQGYLHNGGVGGGPGAAPQGTKRIKRYVLTSNHLLSCLGQVIRDLGGNDAT